MTGTRRRRAPSSTWAHQAIRSGARLDQCEPRDRSPDRSTPWWARTERASPRWSRSSRGSRPADEGSLLLDGREVRFASPMEARSAGVTAVYQDPKLFPHLDVAENLLMGIQPTNLRGLRLDRRAMYQQASDLLARIGVGIDTHTLAVGLSAAELLFVEIARALSADVRLLILDEPTAALTPAEADQLFAVVRDLRDNGSSILLITHRLEELDGLADTVTVLRDGADVASMPMADTERSEIVRLMVGRTLAAEGRRTRDRARRRAAQHRRPDQHRAPSTRSPSPYTKARSWVWPGSSAPAAPRSPRRCSASLRLRLGHRPCRRSGRRGAGPDADGQPWRRVRAGGP